MVLDLDNKLKTENFFRIVFKTFDVSNDGKISCEEVGKVLSALGRPQDEETRQNLVNKYGGKAGRVDWTRPEFLRDISCYHVSDVNMVQDFVYSAAFSTFDQDVDGYICPEDMQGLVKLFLPDKLFKDEEYMRDLIERMDRNNDGMIAYEEFVQTVKETGEPDFFRYYDPVLKAAATFIGFIVYCMSFYFGIAAVFSCNYD